MSYLRYLCLFGLSLLPVVCRRAHVLSTTNTNNVNKTCAFLRTTGGKDEPNIVFMRNSKRIAQHVTFPPI
jgi:hypothetical protein